MNILYSGKTEQGKVRKRNEDCLGLFPELNLFMVADGMGGRPAGDVASRLVVEVLPLLIKQRLAEPDSLSNFEIIQRIKHSLIDLSNRILLESSHASEFKGMGTTLVMALITEQKRFIAHMGDSRAYLFRDRVLQQITNDHNLFRYLLANGEVSPHESQTHPGTNQLLQYIGMDGEPRPTVICIPRQQNEYLLLCSDGLSGMLSYQQINHLLLNNLPVDVSDLSQEQLNHGTENVIASANQEGGKDNISLIITT